MPSWISSTTATTATTSAIMGSYRFTRDYEPSFPPKKKVKEENAMEQWLRGRVKEICEYAELG